MRRLALKKDVLTELLPEELALVAGAAVPTTPVTQCHIAVDPSAFVECDSLLRPCVSGPCTTV